MDPWCNPVILRYMHKCMPPRPFQYHSTMAYGIITSLSKFDMPMIWQAIILSSIWFATETCQTLIFGLPNLWQYFYLTFSLSNLWYDKFWMWTKYAHNQYPHARVLKKIQLTHAPVPLSVSHYLLFRLLGSRPTSKLKSDLRPIWLLGNVPRTHPASSRHWGE